MSELAIRNFRIMRMNQPPIGLEARNFKDFIERAKCRSRTETVRALQNGKSFFVQSGDNDYHSRAKTRSSINVALEAFRNITESGSDAPCFLHMLTHDKAQISFSSLPKKGGLNSSQIRGEFAKYLDKLVSEGTVLVLTGASAHAGPLK